MGRFLRVVVDAKFWEIAASDLRVSSDPGVLLLICVDGSVLHFDKASSPLIVPHRKPMAAPERSARLQEKADSNTETEHCSCIEYTVV
jgi:hypothetical protein